MKQTHKTTFRILRIAAIAAVVLCGGYLIFWLCSSRQHRADTLATAQTYLSAGSGAAADDADADSASAPDPDASGTEAEIPVDFAALQATGPDVIGWIQVAGIDPINAPVVQRDDEYYLTHSWDGSASRYGAIFMEEVNTPDFSDYHTIVYGHNMRDGSMFGSLDSYADPDFFAAHGGAVTVYTPAGTRQYQIFAAEYITAADPAVYTAGFSPSKEYTQFLTGLVSRRLYDTGVTITSGDRVLTLSTCSGGSRRFVVHAVEVTP